MTHFVSPGTSTALRGAFTARLFLIPLLIFFATPSCTPHLEGTLKEETRNDAPGVSSGDSIGNRLAHAVPDSTTLRSALEGIEKASVLSSEKKWEEATTTLRAAMATLPSLDDWTPILLAEIRAAAGDTAGVRKELERADQTSGAPDRWGWLLTVEAFEQARDFSGGAGVAERKAREELNPERIGRPGSSSVGAHAWLRSGQLALAGRDSSRARAAFLEAVAASPRSTHALQAARQLESFKNLTSAERYRVARVHHLHGSWERAHEGLQLRLAEPGLRSEERHVLRFDIGRALFHLSRYREAEAHLLPLLPDSVSPAVAAEALFWTGRAQYRQGRQDQGRATLERVAQLHPESSFAGEALLLLAELEESAGRALAARTLYERAFVNGVRTAETDLIAVRIGSSAYLGGEYAFAARTFDQYRMSGRPASRQQAAFWAALSHQRMGNDDVSRERLREVYDLDPLSYYGTVAGESLGLEILPVSLPLGPPEIGEMERAYANALLRLEVHRRVPLAGSFPYEFDRLKAHFQKSPDRGYGFAEMLIAKGSPVQGIVMGRDLHREEGEWNLRLLRIVYPFPFRAAVVRESAARGLDPFFVAGLIRQESMFKEDIASPAGALGLMQIMPATGRELARGAGIPWSPAILTDPDINVRLGTTFLATMMGRFDGRVEDALSAYNAGPTRIRQWRTRPEYQDRDVFIEHIPFRETRNYVKIVQQNTRIYTALYGCEEFTSCQGMPYRSISALRQGPVAQPVQVNP